MDYNTPKIIAEEMAAPGVPESAAYSDKVLIRRAIQAEFDAVNLYEQIAEATSNATVKKMVLDIASEEEVHIGELEKLLGDLDDTHNSSVEDGREEAEEAEEA